METGNVVLSNGWRKSCAAAIQLKPFWRYFCMVLFFFSILQIEMWDFLNLILGALGIERVKMQLERYD